MAITLVSLLLASFFLIGAIAARKARGGSEASLILAGRSMPVWIALLTMTATWVDGGYLLGTAEGAYKSSIALGAQGGLCFGISLILGGLFFARRMRELEFTTLIDPFEARYGKHWAAVLFIPAILAEVFWSAELLVAAGSSFDVLLGLNLTVAILLAAVVVTAYTALGGMWSVAYTDIFQLGLVALGLAVAIPFVLHAIGPGGASAGYAKYSEARPAFGSWTLPARVNWWDISVMLAFGGIPWNCYFQRVLSCRTPSGAQRMSILSGLLTVCFMLPPLFMGVAAVAYPFTPPETARLQAEPSTALPLLLLSATPRWVALLGLVAIFSAVASSFSASILSAASMFTWNGCRRLLWPDLTTHALRRLIRISVVALGALALLMALKAQSVQALWFFTSDLVFVLLFPQLFYALFDKKSNRIGSIAAFAVSLVLRFGGGEPLLGLKPWFPYPDWFAWLIPGPPASWYDATGGLLFPFKSLSAAAGMLILPTVSRLTLSHDPPRPLK